MQSKTGSPKFGIQVLGGTCSQDMRSTHQESLQEVPLLNYGIEVTGTVEQHKLSTSRTAIAKTWKKVMVAFHILITDAPKE
jgi:hypothetical protein